MQLESSVTLFDDNKVEDRFAELQITADGITSEVSRKVGNDEVISRINQSAEGVQIQANKVNVEGAAIFSSGRLSQSSLNNAYDAKGAATGAVNTLKSDLSSSSGTTVINGGHIATGSMTIGALDTNAQSTIADAAKTASTYITDIGSGGISVHASSNPTSNYIQIDGTGMEVYKGGSKVAKFGANIQLSDGTRTVYEVVNKGGAMNIKRAYDAVFVDGDTTEWDEIPVGRYGSSWSITLTYKVNSTTYTKQYTSISTLDKSGKTYLSLSLLSNNNIRAGYGRGDSATSSETITIVSLAFSFTTSQLVIESTLGANANTSLSGPFRIGNGVSANATSNAMLVSWAGDAFYGGDIYAKCNEDSSGGLSLTTLQPCGYGEGQSGDAWYSYLVRRVGRVVVLSLRATKHTSTSAGSDLFQVQLHSAVPKPFNGFASGSSFYSKNAIGLLLYTSGDNVYLRATNATNASLAGFTDEFYGTITYITED